MNRNLMMFGVSLLCAGAAFAEPASSTNAINACTSKSAVRMVSAASDCDAKSETSVVWIESLRNPVEMASVQPVVVVSAPRAAAIAGEVPSPSITSASHTATAVKVPSTITVPVAHSKQKIASGGPMAVTSASDIMLNVAQYQYFEDMKITAAPVKVVAKTASTHTPTMTEPASR